MTPRGPAPRIAAATSSTVRGTTTRAVVGAVRPHPRRLVVLDIAAQATRRPVRADARPTLAGVTQPPRGIRIGDADRERAAGRLQQALAEGRITLDELEERLAVVYAARYEADLVPPFADLPPADVATHLPAAAGEPLVLRTGSGNLRRSGVWTVPARIQVETGLGTVVLDFCDAAVPPAVEVVVTAKGGDVKLLVPDGATADTDGLSSSWGGDVKCTLARRPVAGHPHFRVSGSVKLGTVVVRNRYRFAGHHW